MSTKVRVAIWVAAALLSLVSLGAAKNAYDRARRAEGALVVRDSVHAGRIAAFQRQLDSLAKVAVVESVTVVKWRTRWDTVTQITLSSDTIMVPGPVVREIVRVGDSAITACQLALDTCRRRLGIVTDSVNREWQLRFDNIRPAIQKPPSIFTRGFRTGRDLAAVYGLLSLGLGIIRR